MTDHPARDAEKVNRCDERRSHLLPYERLDSKLLLDAVTLLPDERLLVLQPFGWHINGHHIPNAAEHFSREGVCEEHGWEVVCDYGPYVAIVKAVEASTETHGDGTQPVADSAGSGADLRKKSDGHDV